MRTLIVDNCLGNYQSLTVKYDTVLDNIFIRTVIDNITNQEVLLVRELYPLVYFSIVRHLNDLDRQGTTHV